MKKLHAINKQFLDAAKNNKIDKLKNLLSQGANIHADDDWALKVSAWGGHLEVVKFLVTQGANIRAGDDEPLRYSARFGHLEIVKFLIAHGANIHARCDEALKNAASGNNNDVWRVLSAFIQEEKLLVAASDYMLQEIYSVESAPKTKRPLITKAKRLKI